MDLHKYDLVCNNKKIPIYKKRLDSEGREYLKKVDEIDLEEELNETSKEIRRINELTKVNERLKENELLELAEDKEFLAMTQNKINTIGELDSYEYLNTISEMKELYNKMPKSVKEKYKNLEKFTKEFVPNFIEESYKKIEEKEKIKDNTNSFNETKFKELQKTNSELEQKIQELKGELKNE